MYPHAFRYHRAASLEEAARLLSELGEEAKLLAGGQSLIPLMKLRLAAPQDLVDLNFIPKTSYVTSSGGELRIGPLTRHAEFADSEAGRAIPILHDCASGIADVQVRNRGTVGGSIAEADPSGDWGAVLLTLDSEVRALGPKGERSIPISKFFLDAYTSALEHDELVKEVVVKLPTKNSAGAYVAFKRCAPVYATASAAVQLNMQDGTCQDARIVLGCVGLTAIRADQAEAALRGQALNDKSIGAAAEAAMSAADPQPDMRGSADYKRTLIGALVKRAIGVALRRSRGERVEGTHYYA